MVLTDSTFCLSRIRIAQELRYLATNPAEEAKLRADTVLIEVWCDQIQMKKNQFLGQALVPVQAAVDFKSMIELRLQQQGADAVMWQEGCLKSTPAGSSAPLLPTNPVRAVLLRATCCCVPTCCRVPRAACRPRRPHRADPLVCGARVPGGSTRRLQATPPQSHRRRADRGWSRRWAVSLVATSSGAGRRRRDRR